MPAAALAAHYYTQHAPLVAAKRIGKRRKHGQALRRQKSNDSIYYQSSARGASESLAPRRAAQCLGAPLFRGV